MQKTSEPMKENWPSYLKQENTTSEPMQELKREADEELWEPELWNNANIIWHDVSSFRHCVDFIKQEKEKSYQEGISEAVINVDLNITKNKARQELKDELVKELKCYFGHVLNDGDGLPMNLTKGQIAGDVIDIIKTK